MSKSKWLNKDTLIYRRPAGNEYFRAGINIATDAEYHLVIREVGNSFTEMDYLMCEIIGGADDGLLKQVQKSDVELEYASSSAFILHFLTLKDRPCGQDVVIE